MSLRSTVNEYFKKSCFFEMARNEETSQLETIKLKYALAFRKLLEENVKSKAEGNTPFNMVLNTNQLSDTIQRRPATISDIFNAKSIPNGLTIVQILEGLGKSYSDFARYFDNFTKSELNKFKGHPGIRHCFRRRPYNYYSFIIVACSYTDS